ncbi:MAG: NHLP bacteriocin export ABC transporter permease/ATPase subunit [Holophaga sp.]|jgi:ATP-binding cassette subfamily C protein
MPRLTAAQVDRLRELPLRAVAPGHDPWRPGPGDAFWVVAEGYLDVFARTGSGARRHLFTFEQGQVAGALDFPEPYSRWEPAAVGGGGARLLEGRFGDLEGPARPDLRGLLLAGFLEAVLEAVAERVRLESQPPPEAFLEPGKAVALASGARAALLEGTGWVQVEEGEARLLGEPGWPLAPGLGPFPLARGLWLAAGTGGAVLRRLAPDELPEWDRVDAVRTALLGPLMAWEGRRLEREEAEEQAHLERRAEAERALRRRSLAALAQLGEPRPRFESPGAAEGDLLAACRLVGGPEGIPFQAPPRWLALAGLRDPLEVICRASRVRSRKVALRGEWWRNDAGPLLGFLGEDKVPVALLPRPRGGYRIQEPGGAPRPLDPESASRLDLFAHAFYRPTPPRPMTGRDLARMVWGRIRGELAWLAGLGLVGAGLGLVFPLALALMVREVIPQGSRVWPLFAGLAALAVGGALVDLARGLALARADDRIGSSLQAAVVDRLLALPAAFFAGRSVGDLTLRALAMDTIREVLTGATLAGLVTALFSSLNLLLVFYLDARLGWLALAFTAVVLLGFGLAGAGVLRLEPRRQRAAGELSALTYQLLGGAAKLRAAAAEGRAFAAWCLRLGAERHLEVGLNRLRLVFRCLDESLPALGPLALCAALGVLRGGPGGLDAGAFLAANAAFGAFLLSLVAIGPSLAGLATVRPLLDRVRPILEAVPEEAAARRDPGPLAGLVEVGHLCFRYREDGPLVLEDVSFRAATGSFVALAGPSGSGKSTLLRLLLGFERPGTGVVHYDRQDLAGLDLGAVRSQMGVVLQSSRVLAGDIFRNIVGSAGLTHEEAWEAAEAAGLADAIRAMPMGMFTSVGEGGSTLSGGQRQRLLVARALARKPRIILFDEATSALDNTTQDLVVRSLERLNATRIIIAHRLSTIERADRIYVLDRGRIVQEGSFAELQGEPGLFRLLAERQVA